MSVIIQQPDALSFSGNLKKFVVSSTVQVSFQLFMGETAILDEKYTPGSGNLVEIDIKKIIHQLLSVSIPGGNTLVTEQSAGIGEFTATIDETDVVFKVIKGGVFRLKTTAAEWLTANNLSWQPQEKKIIVSQPEFLSVYAQEALTVRVKAYYADNSTEEIALTTLAANKLYSVAVDWATIDANLTGNNPIAWDVWKTTGAGATVGFVQRYQLRNVTDSENTYIWANTLGGVDSVSFTGYKESDAKIEHLVADLFDDTTEEYLAEKKREVKQSTGYLDREWSLWLEDFFLSPEKFEVDEAGDLHRIALSESKVIRSTADDLHDYELTFRYSDEASLLNINRSVYALPGYIPEDIVFPELIRDLTMVVPTGGLIVAVQDPTSPRWYQMTIDQLLSLYSGGSDAGTGTGGAVTERVSGVIVWRSGLTYDASDHVYKILGEKVVAAGLAMTLEADANLPRLTIFVGDKYGNIFARPGTPAENPVKPQVAFDEIELSFAYIAAGALEPSNVVMEVVFDEGAEGEWTATAQGDSGITVDTADSDGPENGLVCASATLAIPDETGDAPTRRLGDVYLNASGEVAGYIYSIEPGGQKGWMVSAALLATAAQYQSGAASNGTQNNVAIGMGPTNTAAMMAKSQSNQAGMAAPLCVSHQGGGYSDWCLGARNDIDQIRYLCRQGVLKGLPLTGVFWSSTEAVNNSASTAVAVDFAQASGYLYKAKGSRYNVVAVRQFDDTQQSYTKPVTVYSPVSTLFQFVAPAARVVNGGILLLSVQNSVAWLANTALLIESWNGTVKTGGIRIERVNDFGFDANSTEWQRVVLQLYNFALASKTLTKFTIRMVNSWSNGAKLKIDRVAVQYDEEGMVLASTIEDITFDYNDIESGEAQQYAVDPWASFAYQIVGLVIKSDGKMNDLAVKVNGDVIPALAAIDVTSSYKKIVVTESNNVPAEAEVTIETSGTDSNTPTYLRGKIMIKRIL